MTLRLLLRRCPFVLSLALSASLLRAESAKDWSEMPARQTPDWIRQSVIYEIFPRQFSAAGNLAGITARLDELKQLGVDVLWLMPIQPLGRLKAKGSIGSPYSIRDYYAVNPDYGTNDDLHRLVDGAHARGLKVIIDIVANHTSWDSVMMSHPAYYKQDAAGQVVSPHDWSDVAALNYANPETRRYMRDMLQYWVREFHLDGFRCDVAAEVPTDFWEEVRQDLDKLRPDLLMLAEADKPELLVHAFNLDYAWPMLTTLNKVMTEGASADELRRTWETDEHRRFPRGALHMLVSDNHDETRAVARFGWNGALAASALMFTLDGVPLLYNGMEVGDATESGDPALFEKAPVFWQPRKAKLFHATYQKLIALRHEHPALTAGTTVWLENSSPDNVVSLVRRGAGEEVLTLVNLSSRPQTAAVRVGHAGEFSLLLGSRDERSAEALAGPASVVLGPFEWAIFRRPLKP